jgi:hypothetical protein
MDETEKRRRLARELANLAASLMDTLYALDTARRKAANVVFADADFTGQAGLTHLSKARVDTGIAAVATVSSAFVSNNFDDTFEALRG